MKKVAVILCGSGFKDGSEIRESVGLLWALSKHGIDAKCFAPDEKQKHVVNCLAGKVVESEARNQLVEAARIARSEIKPLSELNPRNFDAIALPGGYGAAKNLCDYAFEGTKGTVFVPLKKLLHEFRSQQKPMAAICIAPMVLAMAFPDAGFELTVGEASEASNDLKVLGHKAVLLPSKKAHADLKNKVFTTPAYMDDSAPLHEIFEGIESMVKMMKECL